MDDSFTKVRNITYDRFVFWSSKQQKGQFVESFYGRLIEQAENYSLGDEENTLISDTIILNMIYHDTKRIVERNRFTYKGSRGRNTIRNGGTKPAENKSKFEYSHQFS